MEHIELIVYIVIALVVLILLLIVLFDRKEYVGNPIDSKEDYYILQEIKDEELRNILYSLKEYQKPLFLDLYYYLRTFDDLLYIERGKNIDVYSKQVLLFTIRLNHKAIIFETKFKGIPYPQDFVIRGKKIEGHIYNEINLAEVKSVIFQIMNSIHSYDFSKEVYENKERKHIKQK